MNVDDVPRWLDDDAKAEWERMTKIIKDLKMENIVDKVMLEGYCQAYSQWIKSVRWINKYGEVYKTKSGIVKAAPQVEMARKAMMIMQNFNRYYDFAGRKWYGER